MNLPSVELVKYLARHPLAAPTLARAGWQLRRRGWWYHAPFFPVAAHEYWEFRVTTATGDRVVSPRPDEMVRAARWALRQPVGR